MTGTSEVFLNFVSVDQGNCSLGSAKGGVVIFLGEWIRESDIADGTGDCAEYQKQEDNRADDSKG